VLLLLSPSLLHLFLLYI